MDPEERTSRASEDVPSCQRVKLRYFTYKLDRFTYKLDRSKTIFPKH